MTPADVEYFKLCHSAGLVREKMLEVGSAKVQGVSNLCDLAREFGISNVTGTDLDPYDGVDFVFDFGLEPDQFKERWNMGQFSTVCIFNVLEHTYDPITVLGNALSCVENGGSLLVVTPSIWPIHSYPGDFNRLLPDWYMRFAERNHLELPQQHFCWMSQFGIEPMRLDSENDYPTFISRGQNSSTVRYWTSRVIHKLFNTYGRSHWATYTAIGAALLRP